MNPFARDNFPRQRSRQGALMAAALLMMVTAGVIMAAWVGLMATRSRQVVSQEDALMRRQSLLNSKVIGRQFLLQHAFRAGGSQAGVWDGALVAPDGRYWGGVASGSWAGSPFGSTLDQDTGINLFPYNATGIMPDGGYLMTRKVAESVVMGSGQDELELFGFLKMTCPVLRGDLFTVYRKPEGRTDLLDVWSDNSVAGHFALWMVQGRYVLRNPDDLFGPSTANPLVIPSRCEGLYVPNNPVNRLVVGTDMAAKKVPPLSLAGVPMSVGSVTGGAGQMWTGGLDVVNNAANPENSLWHMMAAEKAAGRGDFVTVDSANYSYGGASPPLWVERQIPNDPKRPPSPGETVGITYPTDATSLVTTAGGTWNVLFVKMDHPSLPHIRLTAGSGVTRIHQVVFRGQAALSAAHTNAGLMAPVICLIVKQAGDIISPVQDIRFENQNNRRWVLGVKCGTVADRLELNWEGDWIMEGSPSKKTNVWRCVLVNEGREIYVNIKPSLNVRFVGGTMTNWFYKRRRSATGAPRNMSEDALVFSKESNPDPAGAAGPKFSSLTPKDAWLESYMTMPMAGSPPVGP